MDTTANDTLISGVLDRLPMPQPLCDQLRAFPIVASVQDASSRNLPLKDSITGLKVD